MKHPPQRLRAWETFLPEIMDVAVASRAVFLDVQISTGAGVILGFITVLMPDLLKAIVGS